MNLATQQRDKAQGTARHTTHISPRYSYWELCMSEFNMNWCSLIVYMKCTLYFVPLSLLINGVPRPRIEFVRIGRIDSHLEMGCDIFSCFTFLSIRGRGFYFIVLQL